MVFGLSVAVLYEIYSLLGAELQQNLGINQGWLVVWNIFSIFPYIYMYMYIGNNNPNSNIFTGVGQPPTRRKGSYFAGAFPLKWLYGRRDGGFYLSYGRLLYRSKCKS